MIKMIWKTLAVDKMDIEKTADLKCISRLLVEKWHVDQIKMKITVSPIRAHLRANALIRLSRRRLETPFFLLMDALKMRVSGGVAAKTSIVRFVNVLVQWPMLNQTFCKSDRHLLAENSTFTQTQNMGKHKQNRTKTRGNLHKNQQLNDF